MAFPDLLRGTGFSELDFGRGAQDDDAGAPAAGAERIQ